MRALDAITPFGATGEYEDLVEAGIIDPTKVVRIALENLLSRMEPSFERCLPSLDDE